MLDAPMSPNTHISSDDTHGGFPPGHAAVQQTPISSGRLKLVGLGVGGLLLVVIVLGASSRLAAHKDLTAINTESAIPTVVVVHPKSSISSSLSLPGRLQAWADAPVYARTNGYLHRWYADIGDHVKAGQVLADIETPDVDQQLVAATAALATADAQRSLASTTSERWDRLVKVHAVSQQEADQNRGALAARQAEENEARANVSRLQTLTDFKHIVAPFDGVVTSRSTDIGALIVAGDARATPLFSVADNSRLRLYVSVPQNYAAAIKPGVTAQFTVPDRPGQTFTADVVRLAGAVNAQSGAMLIQLLFDNKDGLLKPGAYAQVNFNIPQAKTATAGTTVRIPASALLFRKEGTAVAVVDHNGQVAIRPVQIAQDLGAELAIGAGLSDQDTVIDSPSDAIATGDHVKPAHAAGKAPNA
ncbi:efflux RND transporter periplasmic adaptor subunit [Caulobacter sp. S45]|jgi:RND family efflux transporter MFP subunit|uniref:efflux RND transporter periplasmic adaptor subunit n=1 Tax=Caulobacter sp. S45 TaxID=1641861 RepID=UPI0015761497|nr:efflux RND transporter periplasmic adaptor subunit [Caulobacter sp. S45]